MADITVSLSDDLKQFVDGQVKGGAYGNASDYIGKLLIQVKSGKQRLESLLIEGLESGGSALLDGEEWKNIRNEVNNRLME